MADEATTKKVKALLRRAVDPAATMAEALSSLRALRGILAKNEGLHAELLAEPVAPPTASFAETVDKVRSAAADPRVKETAAAVQAAAVAGADFLGKLADLTRGRTKR
jgi:hypothetical protein